MSLRLTYRTDAAGAPVLMPDGGDGLLSDITARRSAYVPEWRGSEESDAGVALARIFSAQAGAAIGRLRLLPEKVLRETLSLAGVSPAPQRGARVLLAFAPDMDRLAAPLPIPAGFQVTSKRADGGKGDVVWETEEQLVLTPLELVEALAFDGETARAVAPDAPFHPFGERPKLGAALYLGFTAGGAPGNMLSLGVLPEDDGAPVALGGRQAADQPQPVLRWETLDPDRGFQRADVAADASVTFTLEGAVRLAVPTGWGAARPPVAGRGEPRLWLRVRLVSGMFAEVPRLRALFPNAVAAVARQTFRTVSARVERDVAGSLVRLGKTDVVPGSVVLEVDDPVSGRPMVWDEAPTLAGRPGGERAFVLDPAGGVLRFGDGREGAMLPEGLRYVTLRAFATAAGAESAVGRDEVTKPLKRLPGLAGISNPAAAAGGTTRESDEAAIRRGPATVKARGRAVTAEDIALLALEAKGASIARAYAVAGVDATLGGAQRPGAVGVFVIRARRASDAADSPPRAGSAELAAVARHIGGVAGALLARVTVGNPEFTRIRVETAVVCRAGADLGAVAAQIDRTLADFLDPVAGRRSWRLGDMIRHGEITRLILEAASEIVSVPYVTLFTDGLRRPSCADVPLAAFSLPWPDRREIQVNYAEADA